MIMNKLDWHGDTWRSCIDYSIEQRVARIRSELISITSLVESSEVEALLADITDALRRSYCYLREINRADSPEATRHTLNKLLSSQKILLKNYRTCEPTARNLIAQHYPLGAAALETEAPVPVLLRKATLDAIASLPPPKAGRPGGSGDAASALLAQKLAEAYNRHVRKPTVTVEPQSKIISGKYVNFVTLVYSIIPTRLRPKRKGIAPGLEYVISMGIDHINALIKQEAAKKKSRSSRKIN